MQHFCNTRNTFHPTATRVSLPLDFVQLNTVRSVLAQCLFKAFKCCKPVLVKRTKSRQEYSEKVIPIYVTAQLNMVFNLASKCLPKSQIGFGVKSYTIRITFGVPQNFKIFSLLFSLIFVQESTACGIMFCDMSLGEQDCSMVYFMENHQYCLKRMRVHTDT